MFVNAMDPFSQWLVNRSRALARPARPVTPTPAPQRPIEVWAANFTGSGIRSTDERCRPFDAAANLARTMRTEMYRRTVLALAARRSPSQIHRAEPDTGKARSIGSVPPATIEPQPAEIAARDGGIASPDG
jgi:hypothetical protein